VARKRKEIPVARTRVDDIGEQIARTCSHAGCGAPATYPAPRDKGGREDGYLWFCLEHVQAYNRAWDYFKGMSQEEIERYRAGAVTGHRPTWRLGDRAYRAWVEGRVKDRFNFFEGAVPGAGEAAQNGRRLDQKQRRALAEMELDESASLQDIKMRYKQLVKRYHPDANGGDKRAEERFKSISEAYNYLISSGFM
jgi:curved DNA-binding protein CbpA